MKIPNKKPNKGKTGSAEDMHMLALLIPTKDVQKLKAKAVEKQTTMSIILRKLIKDYLA